MKVKPDGKKRRKRVAMDDRNQAIDRRNSKNNNADTNNPPPPLRSKIHLKTTEDIRRLLSCTVNELRRGDIRHEVAGKIIYASQVMLNVLQQGTLVERLDRIEAAVNSRTSS